MTKELWINQAKRDRERLRSLIEVYHPNSINRFPVKPGPITAPAAEAARLGVLGAVREASHANPVETFDEALDKGDLMTVNNLLNAAWFGVPESTSCWQIRGFREAVALMEDLPEENENGGRGLS